MAATKKKTGSRGSKGAKKQSVSAGFGPEIFLLVSLAVSILLMISNFGVGGFVGDVVSSFSLGFLVLWHIFFDSAVLGHGILYGESRKSTGGKEDSGRRAVLSFLLQSHAASHKGYTREFIFWSITEFLSVSYRRGA